MSKALIYIFNRNKTRYSLTVMNSEFLSRRGASFEMHTVQKGGVGVYSINMLKYFVNVTRYK